MRADGLIGGEQSNDDHPVNDFDRPTDQEMKWTESEVEEGRLELPESDRSQPINR